MAEQTFMANIWASETRANPHPVYEHLRNTDPVHLNPGPMTGRNFWFLTRYQDCVAFLKDARFGKQIEKHLPPEKVKAWRGDGAPDPALAALDRHLLNVDPPDHTRLRALVHKAFTPRIVENLRPRVQQIADDLLDEVEGKGEADLIAAYSFPLPITVIAELLGIPVSDRDKFREWTQTLLFNADYEANRMAAFEFVMYLNNLIDERKEHAQDDLLSGLLQAEEQGDKLDHMELLSMIFLLLVAGHETTVNLIANGTLALLQHPDQMALLRANPALIRSAIEEMLRYNGPVETTTWRHALQDVQIGDKLIAQGDVVMAALLAANRDPAEFPDPHRFDITRDPNRHIAFGSGIHYCVGAPLARLEGAIAISTLLRRLPHLELAVPAEHLVWNDSILLHGMSAMPVKF